ncbi:ClC family H(+)/Cl(-) exchange transporter [Pediococcus stilesii]|uniref:ClC family H(+)/Cl(-) exchange transporter n=1 Tax=Pediococcus stilesii TaxID=331679 RepID=UPI00148664F3
MTFFGGDENLHFKIEDTRLLTLLNSIVIGTLIGLIVSTFRLSIEHMLKFFQQLYQQAANNWIWILIILAINVALAFIVGFFVKKTPEISGSGIPQIEGQLAGEYEEKWWPVLWKKFVGGILAIGSGLMLGREGPSIQLGAVVGQGWSEFRHYSGSQRRVMIAGGAAAGLSAAFNAPIASTLFVLEEIYHNFSPLVWISALTSAIVSNFVSLNFFGLTPVLAMNHPRSLPLGMYWHLIILGILLGIFGRLYQICTLRLKAWYGKLTFLPRWLHSIVPFVLIIPVGLLWPSYLGGGNELITYIARIHPVLLTMIILLIVRFVFSMISYGSGLPGGIFLPILTLGAVFGTVYVSAMTGLHLINPSYLPNFVIYAMAGYFAAIGKAPFTAILLITEMVGSLQHLMPLAVVALTAYIVLDLMGGEPIYESLLHQLVPTITATPSGPQDRVEVPIIEGSPLDGMAVRNIKWPKQSLLISIHRGSSQLIPAGDSVIKVGDTLIVTTHHGQRGRVKEYFNNLM